MKFNFKKATSATAAVLFAGATVIGLSACGDDDAPVQDTYKVHFHVKSLGSNGQPGNTTVSYSPDGKTNVQVGEIGDFWEIILDSRFASVFFQNGAGTLAECETHVYNTVVDKKTVGENSWEQCQAK